MVTYADLQSGELNAIGNRLPRTQDDGWGKRRAAGLGPRGCRLLGERVGGQVLGTGSRSAQEAKVAAK